MLDKLPGTIAALGDNAYGNGSDYDFSACYDPTWGRNKARIRPALGNHEYNTNGAQGYFNYFGPSVGKTNEGFYSYDLGTWHIIVLNSNCTIVSCAKGSSQEIWLRGELGANRDKNVLAYWHHPRFSSGTHHGSSPEVQPFWQDLYDYGADVVLVGHEHNYERFAPQDAVGAADNAHGIREFVVGSGGGSHYDLGTPLPNSEVRNGDTYGVLKVTLHSSSYDWQFVPEAGKTFTDQGTSPTHLAP